MVKKLLVLDLDETLIHSTEETLAQKPDYRLLGLNVYFRPHLIEFVEAVNQMFDLSVWTASDEIYARPIIEQIFPEGMLRFLWSSNRCTLVRDWASGGYDLRKRIKKVKRFGYRLESVIVVDDMPTRYETWGNLVVVKPFMGSPHDDELPILLDYLQWLKNVPDVRRVDKRNWRGSHEDTAVI